MLVDKPLFDLNIPNIHDYLSLIKDSGLFAGLTNFLNKYKDKIDTYPASTKYHHFWSGGWRDHVEQVLFFSFSEYSIIYPSNRFSFFSTQVQGENPIPINMDLLIAGSILHDAEKLNRYTPSDKENEFFVMRGGVAYTLKSKWDYTKNYKPGVRLIHEDMESVQMAADCGIPITKELINVICGAAGGYSNMAREVAPLPEAVILHMADYKSAQIYWAHGKIKDK